jgi:tetratricopeptide (TPR) repeat protein
MNLVEPDKCFVVMPFGKKSLKDGSGDVYDFDKVYRVIMQRAIRLAGLEPIRADERKGSNIIHTDMFKDLRDQSVVLADLSLENPNVFYELGIRHVMSSRGTVLMCRHGSELPFDVKLSRVIFYKYDGANLDWEEAERVVQELQFALEQAKRGIPDSPVYALLESVLRDQPPVNGDDNVQKLTLNNGDRREQGSLEEYERLIARVWAEHKEDVDKLRQQHHKSIFGTRALGYLCLQQDCCSPDQVARIAATLFILEQYALANQLYARLETTRSLGPLDLLKYASSLSESEQEIPSVDHALRYIGKARELIEARGQNAPDDIETIGLRLWHDYSIAGMQAWRWELSKSSDDLGKAISLYETAIESSNQTLTQLDPFPIGRLALAHLRLMLLLRIKDRNRDRVDSERHRESILKLQPRERQNPRDVSYLRWYQAITLADAGDGEGSRRKALVAFSEDAKIMNQTEDTDIGRRQYTLLRRFIEHNAYVLQHPSLVGHISQILQIGHNPGL